MKPRTRSRRDPVGHARRRATAQRRVGVGARCACGESRPAALIAGSTPITCGRCMRIAKGKTTVDDHHVAGAANDSTTAPIPTNDHVAVLSEDQYDWPRETRENPDGDPALRAAACIRGVISTVHYLVDTAVLWIVAFLEALSAFLVKTMGRFWWRGTPLELFTPTR